MSNRDEDILDAKRAARNLVTWAAYVDEHLKNGNAGGAAWWLRHVAEEARLAAEAAERAAGIEQPVAAGMRSLTSPNG